jgi:hypothetical protein
MTEAVQGYAAVSYQGEILIKTVSETRRAAMVNWLVTEGRIMVFRDSTDAEIEEDFLKFCAMRGYASIEAVSITLSPSDRGTP